MRSQDVTPENFASIIASDASRSELLAAIRAETGCFPPLINRVVEVAREFKTDRDQLDQIVVAELQDE